MLIIIIFIKILCYLHYFPQKLAYFIFICFQIFQLIMQSALFNPILTYPQLSSYSSASTLTTFYNNPYNSFEFSTEGLPTVIAKKVAGIVEELNSQIINLASLKAYLAVGIPDEAALIRQYCWKVVLGYLPIQKSKWGATIEKETKTYEGLIKMFLPQDRYPDSPIILKKDHPRYKQLQDDYLLWEQIEKDTSRTHAEFSFFSSQSKQILIPYLTNARREKFKLIHGESEEDYQQFLKDKQKQRKTYRYDYMTRILFIYSKLNSKIQYVQGMNEILAPIFYLVNITKPANAMEEAACFFMFNNAICDIIELHIKDLDKSKNGIYGKLNEVNEMLMVNNKLYKIIDRVVWQRMNELKIDPFYYCFRWVTLLYAQDFALFDTIRIWESIFSAKDRCLYINLFAIAIILACKQLILQNEFTVVLSSLHEIRDNLNIHDTIAIADQLYKQYEKTDFQKFVRKVKHKKENREEDKEKKKQEKAAKKEKKKKVEGELQAQVKKQKTEIIKQQEVKVEKKRVKKQKKEKAEKVEEDKQEKLEVLQKRGFFGKLVDKYLSK